MVLAIEDNPAGYAPDALAIDGYTQDQIDYHAYLLIDAGYAAGRDTGGLRSTGPQAVVTRLTWEGHEFAEAARDDSRWRQAMGVVKDKGGSITIDLLKQLLSSLMKSTFGLP
jgi:hypothetical protein